MRSTLIDSLPSDLRLVALWARGEADTSAVQKAVPAFAEFIRGEFARQAEKEETKE